MSLSSFNNVSSHHPAEDQVMKLVSGNIYGSGAKTDFWKVLVL